MTAGNLARWRPLILGLCGAAGALLLWTLLALWLRTGGGAISRLPSPVAVAVKLADYARGDLVQDLAASLRVFVVGWSTGCLAATVIGIWIGTSRVMAGAIGPVIEAIRPVSSIVWLPLTIVWFGFGFLSKIFLVALSVFLVVIVYAIDGARRVPDSIDRAASMLGMTALQRFRAVTLPGSLVEILVGARVALMSGWGTVIVAELVAADFGLGAHLIGAQQSYDIAAVIASMLCFAMAGFAMNYAFGSLEKFLLPWKLHEATRP